MAVQNAENGMVTGGYGTWHNCRRRERRYRRTRRAEDRRLWVDAARRRLRLNRAKYEEYWVCLLYTSPSPRD